MQYVRNLSAFAGFGILSLLSAPASALIDRTYVSRSGNDANACTALAPCATFNGAIAKTSSGGEISCLDSSEFGVFVLGRSMSINCEGARASVTVPSSGVGVNVSTGPSDIVSFSGIDFIGMSGAITGIRLNSNTVGELHVRNVSIRGFGDAVLFAPGNVAQLFLKDSTLASNSGHGLYVAAFSPGAANVHLSRVRIETSGIGLMGDGVNSDIGVNINVQDSYVTGNGAAGVLSRSLNGQPPINISMTGTQVSGNFGPGLKAEQAGSGSARIFVSASMISANAVAITATGAGQVRSFGNNHVVSNGGGEAFTGSDALK